MIKVGGLNAFLLMVSRVPKCLALDCRVTHELLR
jgi:hypothetical protein